MVTVQDGTIVELGKYYNVPCAEIRSKDGQTYFIPTLGPAHTDKKLGGIAASKHIHIDGRFFNGIPYVFGFHNGYTNTVLSIEHQYWLTYQYIGQTHKRRKCIRLHTGVNPPNLSDMSVPQHIFDWFDSFIGQSCKGKKCPHLGTTMNMCDGHLVCPLHGLKGDPATEIIIDRYKEEKKKFRFTTQQGITRRYLREKKLRHYEH